MENTDFLNHKTSNINIRISPVLKSRLIEKGAKMGVNLSDYIGFLLTKDMNGQNDPKLSEEYQTLETKVQALQAELIRYTAVAEPYKEFIGKDTVIDGVAHRFGHLSEILKFIVHNFKIRL